MYFNISTEIFFENEFYATHTITYIFMAIYINSITEQSLFCCKDSNDEMEMMFTYDLPPANITNKRQS